MAMMKATSPRACMLAWLGGASANANTTTDDQNTSGSETESDEDSRRRQARLGKNKRWTLVKTRLVKRKQFRKCVMTPPRHKPSMKVFDFVSQDAPREESWEVSHMKNQLLQVQRLIHTALAAGERVPFTAFEEKKLWGAAKAAHQRSTA